MRFFNLTVSLILVAATASSAGDKVELASIEKKPSSQGVNVHPPVVSEKYEYYDICGCSEEELQCDLKQKCITWKDGRKYDSLTSWDMKWDHGYDQASETCAIRSFRPIVEITFRYPKWKRTEDAPKSLREKWDRYIQNLIVHENGHRDMVVEAANDLAHAAVQLSPASSCDDLDRNVRSLFRKSMEKLKKDQREYDEITMHGTTQGAVFP